RHISLMMSFGPAAARRGLMAARKQALLNPPRATTVSRMPSPEPPYSWGTAMPRMPRSDRRAMFSWGKVPSRYLMALGSSTSRRNLRSVSTMRRCSSLRRKSIVALLLSGVRTPGGSRPGRRRRGLPGPAGAGLGLAPLGLLDHAGAVQDDLGPLVHRDVDHLAVEAHRGGAAGQAVLEGGDHAPRVLDLGRVRREHAVEHA